MSINACIDIVCAGGTVLVEVSIWTNVWAIRRDSCLSIRGEVSYWQGIRVISTFLFNRARTEFVFRAVRGASHLDILKNIFILANLDSVAPFADRCGVMWESSIRFNRFFIWNDHMKRVSFRGESGSWFIGCSNGKVFNCFQSEFIRVWMSGKMIV